MAQQGTNLNQPLYIQAPLPIDGRLIVDTVDGIGDSLVSLIPTNNYPNMYVWVRSEKSFYYLIDSPTAGGATVTDWAQASGGVGATGCAKSGYAPGTSFIGTGLLGSTSSASVFFSSPYQSASYSVAVTLEENSPSYIYSVTDKTITGFTIVIDSPVPIGATAMWITNCWDGSGLFNGVGGGGASIAIDLSEVAFGTGTSITSSNVFTFDNTDLNLIVSKNASIFNSGEGAIITGQNNNIINSDSSLITGDSNNIYDSFRSSVIGGAGNSIGTQSQTVKQIIGMNSRNTIIGGSTNEISGILSYNSSIIGGYSSCLHNSRQSVIIGGIGLTLSVENNVVYVPELKIATASNDESSTKVLVWGTNNYVGYKDASGLVGGGNPPLPVPKINLMQAIQEVDVYNSSDNTISGTSAVIQNYPVLVNMDFTSDHFSNPNNRIFIEMVHYKRKSIGKKGASRIPNGKSYVVPAKNLGGIGQDDSLPWIAAGIPYGDSGFWSRSGASSWYEFSSNTSFPIGIDRPNHIEVTSYTMSSYPIWEYLNGRFEFWNVVYRDITGATSSIETLIPSTGKSRAGRNRPTGRFAYSPYYTPYYCAFRYIQWIPNVNPRPVGLGGGFYGQIVSGPLSKIIKVTGLNFPFQTNYQQSAVLETPVCDISVQWTTHPLDSYRTLKCDWESNLP
jgi:hypothetical protein